MSSRAVCQGYHSLYFQSKILWHDQWTESQFYRRNTNKMVKPHKKSHSIKALERKWRHQCEHIFEAPTFSNRSTKFEPDMTSSFWDARCLKIAKFKWQLSPLNGNDVTQVDMYINPLSHRILSTKVQPDRLNGSWDIVVFLFCKKVTKRQYTCPNLCLQFQQNLSGSLGASSSTIIWRQTNRHTYGIEVVPVSLHFGILILKREGFFSVQEQAVRE